MRSLEQVRSANAWRASRTGAYKGVEGGEVVKKIPQYVRVNGFLGTLAFSLERKRGGDYGRVFDGIALHLSHEDIGLTQSKDAEELLVELSECDSRKLRLVTAEAMAYLSYLRRFSQVRDDRQEQ